MGAVASSVGEERCDMVIEYGGLIGSSGGNVLSLSSLAREGSLYVDALFGHTAIAE